MPIKHDPARRALMDRADQLDRDIVRLLQLREDVYRLIDEAWAEHDAVHAILEAIAPD